MDNSFTSGSRQTVFRRIYARVGDYWHALIAALVLVSVAAVTQPALAYIMKPLLDEGFNGAKPHYIWSIPLTVVGLFLVRGILNFLSDYLLAWIANNMLLGIRNDMFEKLLGMPDGEFQKGDTGRLMNRFTIDAGNITDYATEVCIILVRDGAVVIALLAMLLYLSWQLTLIIFIIMPISVITTRIFVKRLRRINMKTVDINAELTRVVKESIEGQRVVKLFNGYKFERERFLSVNGGLRRFAMRSAIASAAMTPITQLSIAVAVGVVIATALYQGSTGALTVGSFAAFLTALAQIFDPVKRLTNVAARMQKMLVAADSVFTLIDSRQENDTGKKILDSDKLGSITFENVSFRFPDAASDTLSDISFTVKRGETIAFVGRSGSGKTTLVNMIPRFVDPVGGHITIDGTNIADYTLQSLRSQLSLVSQSVVLFEGTMAQNVAYGFFGDTNEDRIRQALASANLLDYVNSLPQGLETPIGENGAWLSGGQRQRLAIARALIKNAPILILDEATSALDNESERQVQASLETLMQGRTTFVIAHRLSTVQNADRILVLDKGRIVEQGNHAELLKNSGLYASLYNMQFRDS
ncbi:lipid A export permease/ATP-binding protein MsbA [Advenella sp. S44]|uniref:lipid A export permease/ATP-binding protein MsbA n=1 Tax=Advenella sp. S44 TaxID=1982755 RepID=UPI000C298C4C|nr:lipid A export permease/ATP-binding protein MsbA [Advenella sp. S44]PJX22033.1 lipid A export permease/ATP-binding protein MsbA [Advenella sp. S44]